MKKLTLVLILVAAVCSLAFAQPTIEIESAGRGATRDDAINNALYHAVAQAKGVYVGSGDYRFGYRSAAADVNRTGPKKSVEFDAVSVETSGSLTRTDVQGLVKSYEVLEEKKTEDGNYQVKLKVWVLDYESLDNAERIRIAVMPMETQKPAFHFGFLMPAEDLAQQLSQKLSAALTATNKFMVLDREYDREFLKEKMLLRADGSIDEQAKLNEVLGADYVLAGTISDAVLVKKEKELRAAGRTIKEYRARFVFDYRLMGGPTRSVRDADTVDLVLETEDIKALYDKWEVDRVDLKEMGDKIIARAAELAAENIVQDFYPIRVAHIDESGDIIVDQGNKRLSEGRLLNVYNLGEEVTDSDTGELLGRTQAKVATIEIVKVLPKMAYAKVIEGELSKIEEGFICKYASGRQKPLQGRKTTVEKTPAGGVEMPFD